MHQDIPPDATPVTTEDLLVCIGELYIQTRVLRRQLIIKEERINGADDKRRITSNNNQASS